MSTLKVDTIQSSSGSTVSVPAGHTLDLAEPPTGAGFTSGVLDAQSGATTGDTASSTVIVDVPFTTIRDSNPTGSHLTYQDYLPYYSVSTRLTYTNGILTDHRGGAGRFLKYINRVYYASRLAILSTGSNPGADDTMFDFGQFNVNSFLNDGLNVWIDVDGLPGTVGGTAKDFTGDDDAKLFYATGGKDAAQKGVWMYHKAMDWFWFDPGHSRAAVVDTSIPGIWIYIPYVDGTAFGWCFWKVIASTESAGGGITPWVWSVRDGKWYYINDSTSTIFSQTSSQGADGTNPVPSPVPTTVVEAAVESAAPTLPS